MYAEYLLCELPEFRQNNQYDNKIEDLLKEKNKTRGPNYRYFSIPKRLCTQKFKDEI